MAPWYSALQPFNDWLVLHYCVPHDDAVRRNYSVPNERHAGEDLTETNFKHV